MLCNLYDEYYHTIHILFQRAHSEYQGWSKDNTSLKLCFNSNTTIQLNQEEQKVDSWRIRPVTLPPQVW